MNLQERLNELERDTINEYNRLLKTVKFVDYEDEEIDMYEEQDELAVIEVFGMFDVMEVSVLAIDKEEGIYVGEHQDVSNRFYIGFRDICGVENKIKIVELLQD